MSHILADREKQLVEMWADNATQREIAAALGVTLGQASGMIHRLKSKGIIEPKTPEQTKEACVRASEPKKPAEAVGELQVLERPPAAAPAPPAPPAKPVVIPDEERLGIGIMQLTSKTCRWVLPRKGKDGMARFCGDVVDHRSLCKCHAGRAFNVPHDWKSGSPSFRRLKALLIGAGR